MLSGERVQLLFSANVVQASNHTVYGLLIGAIEVSDGHCLEDKNGKATS